MPAHAGGSHGAALQLARQIKDRTPGDLSDKAFYELLSGEKSVYD